jgi:hypothetical protein
VDLVEWPGSDSGVVCGPDLGDQLLSSLDRRRLDLGEQRAHAPTPTGATRFGRDPLEQLVELQHTARMAVGVERARG